MNEDPLAPRLSHGRGGPLHGGHTGVQEDDLVLSRVTVVIATRDRRESLLRTARGDRTPGAVAAASGVSLEALRKIESGRVPTPAFFTVAALARALGLPLDQLAAALDDGRTALSA